MSCVYPYAFMVVVSRENALQEICSKIVSTYLHATGHPSLSCVFSSCHPWSSVSLHQTAASHVQSGGFHMTGRSTWLGRKGCNPLLQHRSDFEYSQNISKADSSPLLTNKEGTDMFKSINPWQSETKKN